MPGIHEYVVHVAALVPSVTVEGGPQLILLVHRRHVVLFHQPNEKRARQQVARNVNGLPCLDLRNVAIQVNDTKQIGVLREAALQRHLSNQAASCLNILWKVSLFLVVTG